MAATTDLKLFEAYLAPVLKPAYGIAFYLTRNGVDAEALVLEATERAFSAFHTFVQNSNFKAWFLRILTGLFLQRDGRKRYVPAQNFWEAGQRDSLPRREDNAREAFDLLLQRLNTQEIADAFALLPEENRVVCTLYFLEELTYQEIADIVGAPLDTVRSRLHRGRRALQSSLRTLAMEKGNGLRARAMPSGYAAV